MSPKLFPFFSFLILLFTACSEGSSRSRNHDDSKDTASSARGTEISIKYAKGFSVRDMGAYRLVDVQDPLGENNQIYRYAFVPRGTTPEDIPDGYEVIYTPIHRVVCMTALQMSNFIKLDQTDKVVGISSTRFLFNERVKQQIADKKTSRIGIEGNFDNEIILAISPDVILVSPFKKGGYDAIKNLDIPLVTFLGYKEPLPLGQAEWIKFTAMLLGIEEQANSQFDAIEKRYNELKALAATSDTRPTVLSGEMHGGNWYVVGGKSYLANLFRDAGADYFMHNDNESGGFYVDFETVYAQGARADFWRVVNSFDGQFDYDAMQASDARYADFNAFRQKHVIYCNLRQKPFYENTPVEPEHVLADLIHAFHPELLPDYKPMYYEVLK